MLQGVFLDWSPEDFEVQIPLLSLALKGTVTQNIFSFNSGPKGCKDLGNDNDL